MKPLQGLLPLLGLLAVVVGVRADDKDDVRKLLIGRWEVKRKVGERELLGEMTFSADGKASMKVKGPKGDISFVGTYKLLSATRLEITFTILGDTKTEEHEVKVAKDTLELTDTKKNVQRMKRLK